jgi:hypothetical protein
VAAGKRGERRRFRDADDAGVVGVGEAELARRRQGAGVGGLLELGAARGEGGIFHHRAGARHAKTSRPAAAAWLPFWSRPASDTAKVLSNRKHAQNQGKPASRWGRTFDLPYVSGATLVIEKGLKVDAIYFLVTIIPRRSSRAKLIPA